MKKQHEHPLSRRERFVRHTVAPVVGVAALSGLGIAHAAEGQTPSQKVNVTFTALATNWQGAEAILKAEGNMNGDPRPLVSVLEDAETSKYPDQPIDDIQPGEVVSIGQPQSAANHNINTGSVYVQFVPNKPHN
jgi:hypothetical protein